MRTETLQDQGPQRVINLELPFDLLTWQKEVEDLWHRFNVIAAGRRSGKSLFGINRCVVKAGTVPRSVSWYVAPTYTMAKDIAWAPLKSYLRDFIKYGLIKKINDSELYVETIMGSIIHLKGSDKPDSLRGVGQDLLVLDEYAVMKKAVWEEVLRPGISDRKGEVIFISTPKGYNHFYKVYQKELEDPVWKSWHIKSSEAGIITPEEIEQAKRDMDERVYRQEYEASFETFGGQVFSTFDRKKHAAYDLKFNTNYEFDLGMDFGWTSTNATLFIQVDSDDNVFVFDEIGVKQTPIEIVGKMIRERKYERWADQYKRRKTYDPDVIFCDPAGDSKTETTGTSSVDELRGMGFKVRYKDKYPGVVQDRVNLIRKWLKNEKLRIDGKKCPNLVQAMEMYRYPDPKDDIQSEMPLKDGISDHWIDGLGEFFINRFPIKKSFVRAL